jgi:NTE family protein
MIIPKLGKIGLFEFHRAGEMIDLGYEACRKMSEEIAETIASML